MSDDPQSRLLADFPVLYKVPVQWGDQDAFGHVNNTVHIRWFETGRVAYLRAAGWDTTLRSKNIGPILASITCHYRRQVTFPDTVVIGSRVAEMGRTKCTIEHALFSKREQAIVADGISIVVMFDYQKGRPVRIPDELRRHGQ